MLRHTSLCPGLCCCSSPTGGKCKNIIFIERWLERNWILSWNCVEASDSSPSLVRLNSHCEWPSADECILLMETDPGSEQWCGVYIVLDVSVVLETLSLWSHGSYSSLIPDWCCLSVIHGHMVRADWWPGSPVCSQTDAVIVHSSSVVDDQQQWCFIRRWGHRYPSHALSEASGGGFLFSSLRPSFLWPSGSTHHLLWAFCCCCATVDRMLFIVYTF